MPIEIKINDDDMSGFSEPAKEGLRKAVDDYAKSLIKEANRIEAGRNASDGPPEITHGMVSDAVMVQRRGLGSPHTRLSSKILKIMSSILFLVVGIMYNTRLLQEQWYMIVFVLVIASAVLVITISVLRE